MEAAANGGAKIRFAVRSTFGSRQLKLRGSTQVYQASFLQQLSLLPWLALVGPRGGRCVQGRWAGLAGLHPGGIQVISGAADSRPQQGRPQQAELAHQGKVSAAANSASGRCPWRSRAALRARRRLYPATSSPSGSGRELSPGGPRRCRDRPRRIRHFPSACRLSCAGWPRR